MRNRSNILHRGPQYKNGNFQGVKIQKASKHSATKLFCIFFLKIVKKAKASFIYEWENREWGPVQWGALMKRNTLIFECSGIGPKMLYSGSLGSKNLSKFSFRVLEFFKISRKSTCKIEICANFTGHTWPFFELFLMPIC